VPAKRSTTLEGTRDALLAVALVGTCAGTAMGFAGGWWWAFDLFANFRMQYVFGLVGVVTALALMQRWRLGTVAVAALVANLAVVVPLYVPAEGAPADAPRMQLVSFNANYGNRRFEDIADYLAQTDADVIVVTELTPPLEEALRRRMPAYAFVGRATRGAFGIAVMSRLAVEDQQIFDVGRTGMNAIELGVRLDGERVDVLAVHPPPPMGRDLASERDQQFRDIRAWVDGHPGPVVIAGDLNATRWSYPFRQLLDRTSLRDSQRGFGVQPTWPGLPWPAGIAIDHCLHSSQLATIERRVGEQVGSDHRALHLTLALRRSQRTTASSGTRTSTTGSLSSAR
jgi:endonuclease/exonuclease/phosphatase (EEP) superfamily protein YafD